MPYETMATSRTPALVIYLLDVSASMSQPLGGKKRIEVVTDALQAVLRQMVFRSTKGARISPRYRIAMYAYSDHVYDLLNGAQSVEKVAQMGVPTLSPMRTTDTAQAFLAAEKLLQAEALNLRNCPAPLVCHMTDGEYTGSDPEPIVRRIMEMSVPDGHVLVENIFISDTILPEPVRDVARWPGILRTSKLTGQYAKKLQQISSPLPDRYVEIMREYGYNLELSALMMLPGVNPEMVAMGFAMSSVTGAFVDARE